MSHMQFVHGASYPVLHQFCSNIPPGGVLDPEAFAAELVFRRPRRVGEVGFFVYFATCTPKLEKTEHFSRSNDDITCVEIVHAHTAAHEVSVD